MQAVDTIPEYFRNSGAIPNGVEGAEYVQVRSVRSVPPSSCKPILTKLFPQATGGVASTGTATPTPQLRYVKQPGDRAIELAAVEGRRRAENEILREHGEFVHLPTGGSFPLAVRPYWA